MMRLAVLLAAGSLIALLAVRPRGIETVETPVRRRMGRFYGEATIH